ncbi:HAD-IB family hydrolase [Streptomyces sp. NPDC032472]|uniref:HAD family hydrolase n=1 Tax=Streptomyces sp. NPDC032472 TaxID=3155018 RepID=UPI0033EA5729
MTGAGRAVAFFDLDETLIRTKSMLGYLDFHWAAEGAPPERFRRARQELLARAAAGVPREELNRAYYRHFRGCPQQRLAETGRAWFRQELARGRLFHPPALAALRRHRRAGDTTVLVSGSFAACAGPVAAALSVDRVLCTVPEVVDGVLTGEVSTPVIGEEKAVRARALMRSLAADPQDCHAYGDHASDLPLLRAVGRAVVVGDDPVLREHARRAGWQLLPGVRERQPGAPAMAR